MVEPLLVFGLFAAGFVALVVVQWWLRKRRTEELRRTTKRWGWTWRGDDPYDLHRTYGDVDLFGRGEDRYAYNLFEGRDDDLDAYCMDYHYEITHHDEDGSHTTHYRQSVVIVRHGAAFPHVRIRPEGWVDRAAEFVGFDDIDFESAEFSRRFHVTASDERFAYDLLHTRAMEHLLADHDGDLVIEATGDALVAYDEEEWDPERFRAVLDHVRGLVDTVPDYVWEDRREEIASS